MFNCLHLCPLVLTTLSFPFVSYSDTLDWTLEVSPHDKKLVRHNVICSWKRLVLQCLLYFFQLTAWQWSLLIFQSNLYYIRFVWFFCSHLC
ncbi:hypothetical protein DsansV1_C02g0018431 [Dioscorea sansibarensis]